MVPDAFETTTETYFMMSASYLNLEIKVHDIVTSYRSINILHPVVSELCQSPEFKQIFWSSLNQDLHVICQRSQTLAHGEITAIQKAFAVLMENKEDFMPAVELYVNEILGLKFVSETDRATTLDTMIQTRHSILSLEACGSKPNQSSTAKKRALPSSSQSALSDHKPISEALFVSDGSSEGSRTSDLAHIAGSRTSDLSRIGGHDEQDDKLFGWDTHGNSASKSNDPDEKLKRLFIVYHRARKDFDATSAKTLERTKSAKFLRDTTENCLAYIAAKGARPAMLDELRTTLEETIAIAEQGSGGKKRRFDENWENVPQEPARMRGTCPVPRGRTSEKNRNTLTSRIQKADYHQQSMKLAKRRRSDLPHQLYPASAGQSARRVFGDQHKSHPEQRPFGGRVYGDRYRPTYK